MKAVIMAGGEGTRLRAVTGALPKPLVPLLGRPLMEYILLLLRRYGFTEVCAALRYRSCDIRSAFGDGRLLGLSIQYRVEDRPLGTAGGVKNCADFCGDEDVLVVPVGMADASGPADDLMTEVREMRSVAPEGYGGGLEARQRHILRGGVSAESLDGEIPGTSPGMTGAGL